MSSAALRAVSGETSSPVKAPFETSCHKCNVREMCLPCGLTGEGLCRIDGLVNRRRRVYRGETLYRAGDPFSSLHVLRSGFCKSYLPVEGGREQVSGFHMTGDIMGMDAIWSGTHASSAVALEDGVVCVLPYDRLERLSHDMHDLQRHLHQLMSREIVREHSVMVLLGSMRAEERLAAFLLNLSERLTERGYSASEFYLRMTREDIGSFLGMKLETVSRIFSKFHALGLISVQQRHVRILDVPGLRQALE
ncbi:MAG: fumarate/nitrate reduction transcriptional regulator Fnr [Methyloversatilis sp.]|nr:fumarate/nitrate reduction transcriptional regulator Fnr [Methyloversatilis sp.]MBP6193294.1 fumarate/nitrate reduction transcriptional regulator Fnr [Methyloversatilis sp.]MBP9117253.1 fumarate/nitrate reduction transcriptional regulator Fnr [Methyloversatilis sp.]